jgi:hypothetical protein
MHLSPAALDAAIRLLEAPVDVSREAVDSGGAGNGARIVPVLLKKMVEAPGFALGQQRFQKSARSRAFPVKLLVQRTFGVFIESSRFRSITPESTEFVEALWRRREPVPVAWGVADGAGSGRSPSHSKKGDNFRTTARLWR